MKRAWVAFCLAGLLSGCGKDARKEPPVRLYAGAGLRPAVEALSAAFERQTGIAVEADYAGSGVLVTRAMGDPAADLFMPGDAWYVDRLDEKTGNIAEREVVARFVPVLVVAKGNPRGIRGVADLANPDLVVALGNPAACQVGRASAHILEKAGIQASELHPMESMTVNELGNWVQMNHADVAIVWDAIAANLGDAVETIPIPPEINEVSSVVCGLLKTAAHKPQARAFMRFMVSPQGRKILERMGYQTDREQ